MSSHLKQNTTVLQELLDKINQLPEADNGGIFPSGVLSVTENGTYDVTEYASVEVDVEDSGDSSTAVYRPVAWNDEGEYSFFYLDLLEPLADFSPAQFMECIMVYGNKGKIDITNVDKVSDTILKVYCDINDQTSGIQVYGKVFSWLSFTNGKAMPEFTVAFNVSGLATTVSLAYVYDVANLSSNNIGCVEDVLFDYANYIDSNVLDTMLLQPLNIVFSEDVSIKYA